MSGFLTYNCYQSVHRIKKLRPHLAATPDWIHRPDDKVVKMPDNTELEQLPLFDALYNSETGRYI